MIKLAVLTIPILFLNDLISPVAAPTGIRRHQPGKHYGAWCQTEGHTREAS